MFNPLHRNDFYQKSERGRMLRAMTINDITYWGSFSFISVIFALFVIEYIEGGSATHVGLAMMIYSVISAGFSIPAGRFFDTHKGYLDEVWGLALSGFLTGLIYIAMSFASQLWHLYVAMGMLGILASINMSSWRILFYNNIRKREYGETIGIYQTLFSIGEGGAMALGGFFGETFGFDAVIFWGGIAIFVGGFLPLLIRSYFSKR
mgnify:CR=1 FL=1